MMNLIYISHLQQGKQKNLAYALGLARSFSSPLSFLPISSLSDPHRRKIPIWKPKEEELENAKILVQRGEIKYSKRKKELPIFLMGTSSHQNCSDAREYKIVKQVIDLGLPLFLLPYNYPFRKIRRVLFTENAPGLTDHPLKHQIAATFLPKAFKLENSGVKQIHWNNICHISESSRSAYKFSSRNLNVHIQRHEIDLAIFPVTNTLYPTRSHPAGELRGLLSYKIPILLIPLSSNDFILSEEDKSTSELETEFLYNY